MTDAQRSIFKLFFIEILYFDFKVSSEVKVMACRLFDAKTLLETMLTEIYDAILRHNIMTNEVSRYTQLSNTASQMKVIDLMQLLDWFNLQLFCKKKIGPSSPLPMKLRFYSNMIESIFALFWPPEYRYLNI